MANPTVQELVDYYVNLLEIQYNSKEKAQQHVAALITNLESGNLVFDIRDAYDLDTSIGVQLTILDKYIGVGRFDKGSFITDNDFRFLLKLKIIQNNSNHSCKDIDDSLYSFFALNVIRTSEGSMTMTYFVEAGYDNLILIAFRKGIIPRPMGVRIDAIFSRPYEDQFPPYAVPFYPGLGQQIIDPAHKIMALSKEDGTYQNPSIEDGLDAGWFATELAI